MQVNAFTPTPGEKSGGIFGALSNWIGSLRPSNQPVVLPGGAADRAAAERLRRAAAQFAPSSAFNDLVQGAMNTRANARAGQQAARNMSAAPISSFRAQSQLPEGRKPISTDLPVDPVDESRGSNTGVVINFPEPVEYSRVAKPLSADILQAFGQRRLAADQAYQNALAQEESGIGRFNASFAAAKEKLDNEYENASDRMARMLAGRGLARSPMVRGRGERDLGETRADQLGEMQFNLSSEIEALKQASEQARIQREMILAQIEQDEALARSQSVDYVRVN
jgi:hypothetical protein